MAKFNANEIIEFAIRIEQNGEKFYLETQKKLSSEKVKEVFGYLATEEVKHQDTFKKLLQSVKDYEPIVSYPEEYFAYLKSYADEHIFSDELLKSDLIEKVENETDAINLAIGLEKDSILYYLEIKNLVDVSEQSIIDKIINEERKHYSTLVELKKSL